MTANEIRQAFVDFYRERDHTLVPSAPLVPHGDPSLLFTSAGMVPFKKYYAGAVALPYRRAVSVQKCLRVTDIEDVGRTPRHDTFFEMLGHFSFGDYFKREAIVWNWELFTRVYGLDPERLIASVYEDDDEAYEIWRREIGLPEDRIVRLGAEDNFWGPAGGTGACGPCSELYFDLGPEVDPNPDVRAGDETDRFVEVGNFVFPQFDRQADGRDLPLQNRGIDTGIGLERLAMVIQGKTSIFHTDLFWPLIEAVVATCAVPYEGHEVAMHIIADHVRALTFALGEGVLPSNEGRGYVLRRLIRRAAVQAYQLGVRRPFLHELVDGVVAMMRAPYPEVVAGRERVVLTLRHEEERFGATLEQAMGKLATLLDGLRAAGGERVPGDEAFVLYDTYGLPVELIGDIAAGYGLTLDRDGFEAELERQKQRSRAATAFVSDAESLAWREVHPVRETRFIGYEEEATRTRVARFAQPEGDSGHAWVVLEQTPFYGAAGGQVGDSGHLTSGETVLVVLDAQRVEQEVRHWVALPAGALARLSDPEAEWEAVIDRSRRRRIRAHHTATHLLQAALRAELGDHVAQAGSLVAPERLRFDFTHFAALTSAERRAIEMRVNEMVLRDAPVEVRFSTYDAAVREGVTALFGEKYDADRVRRVRVAGVSEELCGGTHVRTTGEIGGFLILEEGAVAAGTRRIEAVCGLAAIEYVQELRGHADQLRRLLGTTVAEAPQKLEQLQGDLARLKKELEQARRGEGLSDLGALLAQAQVRAGARYLAAEVQAASVPLLRELGDRLREQLGSGVAVLGTTIGAKTTLLTVVTPDLIEERGLRADALLREIVATVGGSGGGKAHMALGGLKDPARLAEALTGAEAILARHLAPEGEEA